MANQFPYADNQVIISSGGAILLAKTDTVMIFGKKGVGVSTNQTFHIDAIQGTVINSNKIELGLRATYKVIKGDILINQLQRLLTEIESLASNTATAAAASTASPEFKAFAGYLNTLAIATHQINGQLKSSLSDVTYTL